MDDVVRLRDVFGVRLLELLLEIYLYRVSYSFRDFFLRYFRVYVLVTVE